MKKYMLITTAILITLLYTASCNRRPDADSPDAFVIISIDALHPDAVTEKNAPSIFSIMKRGFYTLNGKSTNPPKTLYAHASMFTGLNPEELNLQSNQWQHGDKPLGTETIFHKPFLKKMNTAFFYSKEKLGFLNGPEIKKSMLSPDYSTAEAFDYIKKNKNIFVFLHISGLEYAGEDWGWLSRQYSEELKRIDERLKPLIDHITSRRKYILIITSDHAGHNKVHGTGHPEDYKLPFIFYSDYKRINAMTEYKVTDLKGIVENLLEPDLKK